MQNKREFKVIENIPLLVSCEEYQQLLAEFTEIVYANLCQLQKDEPLVHVLEDQPDFKRTGTDD